MFRYAQQYQTSISVRKLYVNNFNMIPFTASTSPFTSFIFHQSQPMHELAHIHTETNLHKHNLHFSKHTMHPFILLALGTFCSLYQDQFHLILQDCTHMRFSLPPDPITLSLGNIIVYSNVTNLEL